MATPPDFSSGAVLTAAQMNAVGMWEITSGTVTSGSSFDITSVFTSDYDSYKLVLTQIRTNATGGSIQLRMLATATPATTGYYYGVTAVDIAAGTSAVFRGNNAAQIDTSAVQGGNVSGMTSLEIHSPLATQYTSFNGQCVDSRAASAYGGISFSGQLANTTSYNGIRVLLSANSFTNCNYKLYGYRN
jgi:hypothetical protein